MNTKTNTTLTFANRDAFIAWRTEWRTEYAALSQRIRDTRRENVQLQRDGKPSHQWLLAMLSKQATAMLEQRVEVKEQSRAYHAAQRLRRWNSLTDEAPLPEATVEVEHDSPFDMKMRGVTAYQECRYCGVSAPSDADPKTIRHLSTCEYAAAALMAA